MYGWQWGMFAPGIVGTAMGLLILLGVRDSPEASACGGGAADVAWGCTKPSRGVAWAGLVRPQAWRHWPTLPAPPCRPCSRVPAGGGAGGEEGC